MLRAGLLGKLTLLSASLLIALCAAELAFRRLDPVDTGRSYEYRVPHPVLGWVLAAGASYLNEIPEGTVRVDYNSDGWRDLEHPRPGTGGDRMRVAVLGDSFMEAYSVALEDSFHRRLAQLLEAEVGPVEVLNFGVGGYGTVQQALLFQEIVSAYRPDLVLLGFFPNDVTDNSIELQRILFRNDFKITTRPFLDAERAPGDWRIVRVDYEGARRRFEAASRMTLGRWLGRHSALARRIRLALEIQAPRAYPTDAGGHRGGAEAARRRMAQYGVDFCEEPEPYTRAWETTRRALQRLELDVARAGGRLVVFSVPAVPSVDRRWARRIQRSFKRPELVCFEEAPGHRRLARVLEALEVPFIELLDDFRRRVESTGERLYHDSDLHWNEAGHRLAAERVALELLARGLVGRPGPADRG